MGSDKASKKKDKKDKKAKAEATPAAEPVAAAPAAQPVQEKAKKEKKEKKQKKDKKEKRTASEAETPAETAAPASPAKKQKTEEGAVPAPSFASEDERKIFIGGCPDSIDDTAVQAAFEGVESCRWVQKDGQFRGFGFIVFNTPEQAQAVANRGEVEICGKKCRVNMAGSKPTGGAGGGAGGAGGAGGSVRADDARRVFIGRCPDSINDESVSGFEGFESVRWVSDRTTGKFKGVGFITFADEASAQKLASKGSVEINGQSCVVRLATEPPGGAAAAGGNRGGGGAAGGRGDRDDSKTLFIGGCPDEIEDGDVQGAFSGVANIRWVKDRETGAFKGAGFVEFDTEENAKAAAAQGSVEIKGRSCRVSMAGDKPAGRGGAGGGRGGGGRGRGRGRGPPKTSLENLGQGSKMTFDD